MKYKFRKLSLWDELKTVTDRPANVAEDGEEILFDFGGYTLTPDEEEKLGRLMEAKPLFRGNPSRLVEKGEGVELEELGKSSLREL